MQFIGIDIHRKFSMVHVMAEDGNKLDVKKLYHDDIIGLREYFADFSGSPAAVEATVGWMWLADELESLGIDVHLAHPSGVRRKSTRRLKTDKVDAELLAELLRTNSLPEAYLAPMDVRIRREILRYRMALIKVRTMVKNRIHALLIRLNIHPQATDIFGVKSFAMLRALQIDEPYFTILQGWLDLIEFLNSGVQSVEKVIHKMLVEDDRCRFLMTLPGVGLITAYTIIAEMGEISRFRSDSAFASYCGFVPSTHQSGPRTYHGGIGPGRRTLKWCIVEACHTAVRRDSYFASIYQKHRRGKGNGKALVIAAHQMARIIYKLLTEKRGYTPRPKQRKNNSGVGPIAPMMD